MSATIPTSEEELAQAKASLVYRSQSVRETQYLERCIQVVEEAAVSSAICQNCRFWIAPEEYNDPDMPEWGCCRLGKSEEHIPEHPEARFRLDYWNRWGTLLTRPNFGCVEFKEKPNA